MGVRDVLLLLLAAACGFLITLAVTGRGDETGDDGVARQVADLERRTAALEDLATKEGATLTGGSDPDRLAALEARLALLEGAPVAGSAPPRESWTDADVASLRAGLRRVQAVEQRDREAGRFRNVVAHIAPDADPELRERTVGLLLGYMADVRALQPPPGAPPPTQEERKAAMAKTDALRDALGAQLRILYPEPTADRLLGLAPGGASQPPPIERPR